MSRKVDPVHFFDALGESVLTRAWKREEIERLREENDRLRHQVKALAYRLRQLDGDDEEDNERAE